MSDRENGNTRTDEAESKTFVVQLLQTHLRNEPSNEATSSHEQLMVSSNGRNPIHFALSMDCIVEAILSRCDILSLYNIRLVSSRWSRFGSKELQKRIKFSFACSMTGRGLYCDTNGNSFCGINYGNLYFLILHRGTGKDFSSLTNILNESHNASQFPCNSLKFPDMRSHIYSSTCQDFFSVHGGIIKKMEMCAEFIRLCEMGVTHHSQILLQDLMQVLLKQAPNLETLKLDGGILLKPDQNSFSPSEIVDENKARGIVKLDPLDFEFKSKSIFEKDGKNSRQYLNLKYLSVSGEISHFEIFNEIVQHSPNLVQVDLNLKNVDFFFKSGRLDLFKSLNFNPEEESDLKFLEDLLKNKNKNTQFDICSLEINLANLKEKYLKDQDQAQHAYLWIKVARLLQQILEATSSTLKKLTLDPLHFLEQLKFPHLPKLTRMTLHGFDGDFKPNSPKFYLPRGTSLKEICPGLKIIRLKRKVGFRGVPIEVNLDELPTLLFENREVVESVREFHSPGFAPGKEKDEGPPGTFQEMFPNANWYEIRN